MKIAIRGHKSRGKEVIQILESMGGVNRCALEGNSINSYYYIDYNNNNIINCSSKEFINEYYEKYTLEEFEKEFPFKVGDLCIYSSNILGKDTVVKVLGMTIENDCIMYEVGHRDITKEHSYIYRERKTLKPYKEMKEERNITLTLDKAKEWYNKGGELKEIALQAFTETELNPLPRSWEEYCRKYEYTCLSTRYTNIPLKYDALLKLEQLRDCWRQGWKPTSHQTVFVIKFAINGLGVYEYCSREFLSFKDRKTATEFLKCFRDLIEETGDLI